MPDPITPISDEDLDDVREMLSDGGPEGAAERVLAAVLARLDAAEAQAEKADIWQMRYEEEHEVMGEKLAAALASPEGVATLDGKQWRVVPGGFGFDNGDQTARLVPYRRPEDTKGCE